MLVLSSKIRYGSAALLELTNNYGGSLLQAKVIAERRGIPSNYLEQLLSLLTKAGLVRAVRGNKGGYELARDPATISFLQILEILERGSGGMTHRSRNVLEELYQQAEGEIKKIFSISLAELAAKQKRNDSTMMFHI